MASVVEGMKRSSAPGIPVNLGKTEAMDCPAYWRDETAVSLAWGWRRRRRTSSSPE